MSEALEAECMNPTTLENPLQGLSRFRSQSHIAQQSRRDKMRVHQNFTSPNFSQIPNQMLHEPGDPGMMCSELAELRNAKNCDQFKDYMVATTGGFAALYDSTMFPSEMLNFPTGAQVLFDHKEAIPQPHPPAAYSKPIDAQNPSDWKGSNWQQNCEFIMNYVQGPGNSSGYYNQNPLLAPMFVGGLLSGTLKDGNFSSSQLYLMNPNCNGYQDVQSSANNPSSEISSQDSQKQYANPNFPSFQRNTLSEDVTSSTVGSQAIDMGLASQTVREPVNDSWGNGGTELLLLPSYENQSTVPRLGNIVGWTNGIVDTNQSNQEAFVVETSQTDQLSTTNGCDGTVHGLSLSLSSNPPSELHLSQSEDRYQSQELPSRNDSFHGAYDQKAKLEDLLKRQCLRNNLGYFSSNSRCSETVVKCSTIASSSTDLQRNAGPLGPFTGYATILKSSKFLEPAQQLLDEFCSINRETKFPNPRLGKEQVKLEMGEGDVRASCTPVDAPKLDGNTCSPPSLSFNPSGQHDGETRFGSAVCQGYRSEFQRKKAKLLFMLDEVFRRYKQYHHQVQMVISSFESVAGLSSATPYTCSALKVVSKHFRYLKNAISDQIQNIIKSLGKECCTTPGTSTSKGEAQTPRLKMLDQSLQKQKATENLGTFEHQQHVWRPQRGLPERSVAVLRSWLFEHFLHPYPNDADKHILASQTGLSRSQVSNWFINARVRLWKPMVEEIHMLEIKESSEVDLNSGKSNQKQVLEERPTKNLSIEVATSFNGDTTAETSPIQDDLNDQLRQRQKRSRMEDCQIPAMVNGGSIGFASYQSGGLEMGGGIGSISLTLGLHSQQQQQQQQQQLLQLGKNTSTHFLHDFVG